MRRAVIRDDSGECEQVSEFHGFRIDVSFETQRGVAVLPAQTGQSNYVIRIVTIAHISVYQNNVQDSYSVTLPK